MKCDKCGNDINENLFLCPKCGNVLKKPEREPNTNNNPVNGLSATTKSPFNEANTTRDTKALESIINTPNGVRNTTIKLLTSVELYVLIGFYVIVLIGLSTLLNYAFQKGMTTLAFYVGWYFTIMKVNIAPAIFYTLFFNKANIPIGLAAIPGINVLTYYRNGLYDYDRMKDAFTVIDTLALMVLYFPTIFGKLQTLLSGLFPSTMSIYGLIATIVTLVVYIRANNNYCMFFGFESTAFRILSSIIPVPMQLIVIFDNSRVFKK